MSVFFSVFNTVSPIFEIKYKKQPFIYCNNRESRKPITGDGFCFAEFRNLTLACTHNYIKNYLINA